MSNRYWYELDQNISPLGFGCWQLAGEYYVNNKPQGWRNITKKEIENLIHYALDNGIQFFDTAIGYGNGKSEELLGNYLNSSSLKNQSVVCTKIPISPNEAESLQLNKDTKETVENSLKRLQRESIDVLLIHNPPDTINWEVFDTSILEQLKKEGKIRSYGVSAKTIKGASNVAQAEFGSCIEWVFNLFERRPVDQLFPQLKKSKINFIARSPLSRGLFSAKYLEKAPSFSEKDFRSTLPKDWMQWVVDSLHFLELTQEEAKNISNLAINYCLYHDEISVVIPGINKMQYLESYLKTVNHQLFESFLKKLIKNTPDCFPKWA